MTYLGPETVVSCVEMKKPFAYIGGVVIVAVIFLAVFVGGANPGNCSRTQSDDAPAAKSHH